MTMKIYLINHVSAAKLTTGN